MPEQSIRPRWTSAASRRGGQHPGEPVPPSKARRWTSAALAVAVTLALPLARPASLAAHEGHVHKVLGTVTAVADAELTVRDRAGESVAIRLTDETHYFQGDQEATRADVEVGSRVVVSAVEKDGALTAQEVRIGARAGG